MRHADAEEGALSHATVAETEQMLDKLATGELRLMMPLYRKAGLTIPYDPPWPVKCARDSSKIGGNRVVGAGHEGWGRESAGVEAIAAPFRLPLGVDPDYPTHYQGPMGRSNGKCRFNQPDRYTFTPPSGTFCLRHSHPAGSEATGRTVHGVFHARAKRAALCA